MITNKEYLKIILDSYWFADLHLHQQIETIMKTTEFKLKESSYNFSCNVYPAKSHYKSLMSLGRVLPTTLAQARYFLQQGICLDALNSRDVEVVESLLNKHGFKGQYTYTKSGRWVRLANNEALNNALKAEYSILLV